MVLSAFEKITLELLRLWIFISHWSCSWHYNFFWSYLFTKKKIKNVSIKVYLKNNKNYHPKNRFWSPITTFVCKAEIIASIWDIQISAHIPSLGDVKFCVLYFWEIFKKLQIWFLCQRLFSSYFLPLKSKTVWVWYLTLPDGVQNTAAETHSCFYSGCPKGTELYSFAL